MSKSRQPEVLALFDAKDLITFDEISQFLHSSDDRQATCKTRNTIQSMIANELIKPVDGGYIRIGTKPVQHNFSIRQ